MTDFLVSWFDVAGKKSIKMENLCTVME